MEAAEGAGRAGGAAGEEPGAGRAGAGAGAGARR